MLYEFKKGNNASQSAKNIQNVYGTDATSDWMCRCWFSKFSNDDFSLKDAPRDGQLEVLDNEQLQQLLEVNPTTMI